MIASAHKAGQNGGHRGMVGFDADVDAPATRLGDLLTPPRSADCMRILSTVGETRWCALWRCGALNWPFQDAIPY